jgi:predicted alpha-1,2-mannosidase
MKSTQWANPGRGRTGAAGRRLRASVFWAATALVMAASAEAATTGFATSFETGEPQPVTAPAKGSLAITVGAGPSHAITLTGKADAGFTGVRAVHYGGTSSTVAENVTLFDIDVPVEADTELSYRLLPQTTEGDLHNPATYIALDLVFSDGTRLSTLHAVDQHRFAIDALAQGQSRSLYPDQWNAVRVAVGAVARGKTIRQIVLTHHDDAAGKAYQGFLDDVRIGATAVDVAKAPSDYVDTRRGSNANARFSRGNNFPAVAVPHGFNFWTPTTNAGSDWIYQYQERNGADNRPRIEAFALSHEPSPWMGDRQTFQIMPAAVTSGAPPQDRAARALSFVHANETAHPDYYRVAFDNGIVTEMTPTDHAAIFRFSFAGDRSQLVFDNRNDNGGIALDPGHRAISGWSDVKSKLSTGATRMFFYASFDKPVTESGKLTGAKRDNVGAWIGFDTHGGDKVVTMRIATSLISLEQAQANLAQEIAADDSFETVRERARKLWNDKLGIVEVDGASRDDKVVLYSNLYRLFLYPNSGYENTGTTAAPHYQYASPFSAAAGQDTGTKTGARIVDGKVFVNNGFWDTYRTAWPAYALLTPHEAGEMIDGFVQQYRDGGWIARWTSPGYADLMVGTSSDVAFADAWLKGVHNFDVRSFYQSALKNSAVVSPVPGAGRKGIEHSLFRGYTDTSVDEGLSWSMDGYINDFAIGNLAEALAKKHDADDSYAAHYGDDASYYHSRALNYVNLFDKAVGFFVGRDLAGVFRSYGGEFNPKRWGGDYTETDAWGMAFHAPQDGAGLVALYGGRAGLAKKLDALFSAGGDFDTGSYGGAIHEMLEARDVRMGQYGHSNQPAHHIIYMYDVAGQPWKTQDKVRDAMRRLYVGSEIGQGYPGDEDNGEMSAWWVWGAAGFYPLRMGTPEYVVGAPYFPHLRIRLENGKQIVVNAPGVSDVNRYVQSLRVNGKPWNKVTLPHELMAAGATLDFVMGPQPSKWGSDPAALPASLTAEGAAPSPLVDLTGKDRGTAEGELSNANAAVLFDDDSSTDARLSGTTVGYQLKTAGKAEMYTLTNTAAVGDPRDWRLEGSSDGTRWTTLDERHDEVFPWRRQTRAFAIAHPGTYTHYRLSFERSGKEGIALAEIELLGHPAAK